MLEEKESAGNGDDADKITEDDIKGAASTMYAAGADTMLSTLVIFVLCMVLNPDVQKRARQELDRVIGRDRLPSLSDRGKLPCIGRIFHETVRQVQLCDLVFVNCSLIEMLQDGTLLFLLEFPTSRCLQNMFIPKGYSLQNFRCSARLFQKRKESDIVRSDTIRFDCNGPIEKCHIESVPLV